MSSVDTGDGKVIVLRTVNVSSDHKHTELSDDPATIIVMLLNMNA